MATTTGCRAETSRSSAWNRPSRRAGHRDSAVGSASRLTSTSGVNSGWIATPSSAATGTSSATISEIALKGRISPPCSRHRPHTACTPRARALWSSSSRRRLLPIPASPATSSSGTRCAGSRASNESMASRPDLTSPSRPTIRSLESRLFIASIIAFESSSIGRISSSGRLPQIGPEVPQMHI